MGVSKTNKTYASRYKTDVSVNQSTNVGFDSTTRVLVSGDGAECSTSLSDDVLQVKPLNDNTTSTLIVQNSGGSNILAVDTTNSKVLVGASQVAANTMYQSFSCNNLVPVAGYHMLLYAVPVSHHATAATEQALGNGTDPSSTYDMSTGNVAQAYVNSIWRVQDNITIDSASFFISSVGATTDTYTIHITSYTIDTDNGSTSGDLSAGAVVVDSGTIASDRTAVDFINGTVQSADVDAGKILIATLESDGTDVVSCNMTMKYHTRYGENYGKF